VFKASVAYGEWLHWATKRISLIRECCICRFQFSEFHNLYLCDLSGKQLATVTSHPFEVANIVRVDEAAGQLFYTARDGDNTMKLQLHRGKGDRRPTDPAFTHSINLSSDGKYFVDVAQTHDVPPVTRLLDGDGKIIDELAQSDRTRFDQLGLKRVELMKYKAADGKTDLRGVLHFPSNFDPQKKYPLLVSVYGGPETYGASENFATPSALTEYGFLYASLDSRSAASRGKRFLDAICEKLGIIEIDDQAAGVKSLWDRPYLDRNRVGIFGTSYGGYDAGSAMTYVKNLKGRLMLFYGTQDNNVHPSNTMQLIKKLREEGKSFELQVGPDQGHSGLGTDRMMEFSIESLVLNNRLSVPSTSETRSTR
jgi:dipeptidyl-peptidase 4